MERFTPTYAPKPENNHLEDNIGQSMAYLGIPSVVPATTTVVCETSLDSPRLLLTRTTVCLTNLLKNYFQIILKSIYL